MASNIIAAAQHAAYLRAVRMALLPLHKTLLDVERARYTAAHGPVDNVQQVLRLVMYDAWFAWLKPLAALIVQIDERLADDTPLAAAELNALRDSVADLIQARTGGEAFRENYQRVLQDSPDAVVAHGRIIAVLKSF